MTHDEWRAARQHEVLSAATPAKRPTMTSPEWAVAVALERILAMAEKHPLWVEHCETWNEPFCAVCNYSIQDHARPDCACKAPSIETDARAALAAWKAGQA